MRCVQRILRLVDMWIYCDKKRLSGEKINYDPIIWAYVQYILKNKVLQNSI